MTFQTPRPENGHNTACMFLIPHRLSGHPHQLASPGFPFTYPVLSHQRHNHGRKREFSTLGLSRQIA